MTKPLSQNPAAVRLSLSGTLVALAETPADVPEWEDRLRGLVESAADRVGAVDYASVTGRPDDGTSIVAASGALVHAVDEVPVDDVLPDDAPVDGRDATPPGQPAGSAMAWPGFRATAAGMGLHVVSAPVYCGNGEAIATLDLYGRDAAAMAVLAEGVAAAYDPERPLPGEDGNAAGWDAGGEELILGLAEAYTVRETIQLALSLMHSGSGDPYPELRLRAAEKGISLLAAATAVITDGA
ncbi:hypothetical protein [Actinoplanes sp. DH11]|uniref:hypothetical protein n=1 Tax=Actinoplanes sp. DH11 TaxID=2857011 RepID=UPI001E58A4A2|nr:hypothetical protein [Actinoplanes sp. DH11]